MTGIICHSDLLTANNSVPLCSLRKGVVPLFLLLELRSSAFSLHKKFHGHTRPMCGGPHIATTPSTKTRNWLLDMGFRCIFPLEDCLSILNWRKQKIDSKQPPLWPQVNIEEVFSQIFYCKHFSWQWTWPLLSWEREGDVTGLLVGTPHLQISAGFSKGMSLVNVTHKGLLKHFFVEEIPSTPMGAVGRQSLLCLFIFAFPVTGSLSHPG